MSYMFSICSKLSSLPDTPKWNTKKASDESNIFTGCNEKVIKASKNPFFIIYLVKINIINIYYSA